MSASNDPVEWRPSQAEIPPEEILDKLRIYGQGYSKEHMPTEAEIGRLNPGQIQDCFAWLAHHADRRKQKVAAALAFIEQSDDILENIIIDHPVGSNWRATASVIAPHRPTVIERITGVGPSIGYAIFDLAGKLQEWLMGNHLAVPDEP